MFCPIKLHVRFGPSYKRNYTKCSKGRIIQIVTFYLSNKLLQGWKKVKLTAVEFCPTSAGPRPLWRQYFCGIFPSAVSRCKLQLQQRERIRIRRLMFWGRAAKADRPVNHVAVIVIVVDLRTPCSCRGWVIPPKKTHLKHGSMAMRARCW